MHRRRSRMRQRLVSSPYLSAMVHLAIAAAPPEYANLLSHPMDTGNPQAIPPRD